jgi:hypothetical protein
MPVAAERGRQGRCLRRLTTYLGAMTWMTHDDAEGLALPEAGIRAALKGLQTNWRNLRSFEIDRLTTTLLSGHTTAQEILAGDLLVFRARPRREDESFTNVLDLWAPPAAYVKKIGRFNAAGQSQLYCAGDPFTAMYELRPSIGSRMTMVVGKLRSSRLLKAFPLGMSEYVHKAAQGFDRGIAVNPQILADLKRRGQLDLWLEVDRYLSRIATRNCALADEHRGYWRTNAVSRLYNGYADTCGLIYPSVARANNGFNLCLAAAVADDLFYPVEAWDIRIGQNCAFDPAQHGRPVQLSFEVEQAALAIDGRGDIQWSGRAHFNSCEIGAAHEGKAIRVHTQSASPNFAELRVINGRPL